MLRVACLCLLMCCSIASAATWKLVYPRPMSEQDPRSSYPIQLLEMALEQTGVNFALVPSDRILLQGRALRQLAANREINVVWSMTDETRERELLPIRIPIYKGLIGWRVFLVKNPMRETMGRFEDIGELRELLPVQGHDWPDTKILQANGFEVITGQDYSSLFDMLGKGRADFFPRSIIEVWPELDTALGRPFVVEENLGLHYPTAMYFFVNRKSKTLGKLIEAGLEKAIANGKFDAFFNQAHADLLVRTRMKERRFFHLNNPVLPEATPVERKELWYLNGDQPAQP